MALSSLHQSTWQDIEYLQQIIPEGAKAARKEYVEVTASTTTAVIWSADLGNKYSLMNRRQEVLEQEMAKNKNGHLREDQIVAEMNALVVKNAEEYHRPMMTEDVRCCNLR